MKRLLTRQDGFSLMELLVAVAVMAILLAGAFGLMSTSLLSFQNTADQGTNIQLSRSLLNAVSDEVRNATAVQTPAFISGTAHSSQVLDYTFPDAVAPNRRIAMGTGSDANNVLILNRSNSSVIQRIGQGRVKAASLNFIRDAADQRVFTVNLILRSNAYTGSVDTPVSTVITTLNSGT